MHEAEGKPEAFDLIIQAGGLWPDPLTMSSLRDFYIKRKDWDKAWEVAQKGVYEQRGWLFKHYFPGLFTLNQIARARILKERAFLNTDMALLKDSLREYRQLLSQWRPEATTYHLGQSVRREADQVQAAVTEGVRHG